MIVFSCPQCGMKFQVKDEFAGRSTRCSTCKAALTVPTPALTPVPVAVNDTIAPVNTDGGVNSLVQAGGGANVTLAFNRNVADDTAEPCSVKEVLDRHTNTGDRYIVDAEIARGGMGTVMRAVDSDIRREVALKFLIDQSSPTKTLRFIEEAQITGQLEHPNIVPVHELGMDAKKRVFFSMKMVKGRSLAQILDALRDPTSGADKEFTLGRLLNILVSACNALAYAHAMGVVHRDLKPANIMVGDFGEVYVMDWGLAKVLTGAEEPLGAAENFAAAIQGNNDGSPGPSTTGSSQTGSSKVQTSRAAESELTMEGTVMGTPVYMPPEQASGRVRAIGRRSDVYSLGAILYEVITLEPPIERGESFYAVLQRVVEGNIVPPLKRNPKRTREGKVPPELAAVAMKALEKQPIDRYASVEALRRDIELFQEGRSVSAKEDSAREMIVRYVKRNRAFTAVIGVAAFLLAVTLIWSFWANYRNAQIAQKAYEDSIAANRAKVEQARKSIPALVEAARYGVEKRRFDNALSQVKLALDYDPDHLDALLLHGQLLVARKDFAGAQASFDRYLKTRTRDENVRELRDRCGAARPGEQDNLFAIALVLVRQQAPNLAEKILQDQGSNLVLVRQQLLDLYRKRINNAWAGLGDKLTLDASGAFALNFTNCKQVTSLGALEGMPIARLNLHNCIEIRDLTPLKGMPLTWLNLYGTHVTDLTPVQGMALTSLEMTNCTEIKDLTPLKEMPLTTLTLNGCKGITDVTPLAELKLTSLRLPTEKVEGLDLLRKMTTLTTINGLPADDFWAKLDEKK